MRRLMLLCVISLLLCTSSASAEEVAGVVTSVTGIWFLDGSKVVPWQQVRVGAVIKAKEPNTKYARVTVMLLDFTELSSICDRHGRCAAPLRVPNTVRRRTEPASFAEQYGLSFWQRFVRAVNKSREPKFRKTLTRSGDQLADQVVPLRDEGVDLGPIFKAGVPGEFLINVRRPTDDNSMNSGWVVERQLVEWTGKGSVFLRSLPPGLYILNFLQLPGARNVLPSDVWILVVDSSNYEVLADEYRRAAAGISRWDRRSNVLPDDFLRAFLADLLNHRQP